MSWIFCSGNQGFADLYGGKRKQGFFRDKKNNSIADEYQDLICMSLGLEAAIMIM